MLTSEELRVAALDASAKRGKVVARRRIFRRWTTWVLWSLILPTIGLATVLASTVVFAAYLYFGFDELYSKTQNWVQINVQGKRQTNFQIKDNSSNQNNPNNDAAGMQLTPSTTIDNKYLPNVSNITSELPSNTQPEGQKP